MSLNPQQKKALKQRAHHLKPVVRLGAAGLTEAVLNEINLALDHHELLKIKIGDADRDDRKAIIEEACKFLKAELVQTVGGTAVLFRKKPE